ncbi:hypothetical protein BaRGS_00036290 [Batillaria attramentaria]|uniref:Uncharacterized protein n=1 Tax=Batillaria attramentaria TaxID=370345 RepID=A0ABD0JC41_9CAEN
MTFYAIMMFYFVFTRHEGENVAIPGCNGERWISLREFGNDSVTCRHERFQEVTWTISRPDNNAPIFSGSCPTPGVPCLTNGDIILTRKEASSDLTIVADYRKYGNTIVSCKAGSSYTCQIRIVPSHQVPDAKLPTLPVTVDGTETLSLMCVISPETTRPYTWSGVQCNEGNGKEICTFTPGSIHTENVVTCLGNFSQSNYNGLTLEARFDFNNANPPDQPVITGYTTGQVLQLGHRLEMVCTVYGGSPKVSSIDFTCTGLDDGEDTSNETSVSSSVIIPSIKGKKTHTPTLDSDHPVQMALEQVGLQIHMASMKKSRLSKNHSFQQNHLKQRHKPRLQVTVGTAQVETVHHQKRQSPIQEEGRQMQVKDPKDQQKPNRKITMVYIIEHNNILYEPGDSPYVVNEAYQPESTVQKQPAMTTVDPTYEDHNLDSYDDGYAAVSTGSPQGNGKGSHTNPQPSLDHDLYSSVDAPAPIIPAEVTEPATRGDEYAVVDKSRKRNTEPTFQPDVYAQVNKSRPKTGGDVYAQVNKPAKRANSSPVQHDIDEGDGNYAEVQKPKPDLKPKPALKPKPTAAVKPNPKSTSGSVETSDVDDEYNVLRFQGQNSDTPANPDAGQLYSHIGSEI